MNFEFFKGVSFYTKILILGGVLTLFGMVKRSDRSRPFEVKNEQFSANTDSKTLLEITSE